MPRLGRGYPVSLLERPSTATGSPRVSGSIAADAATVTIPAHEIGDLIILSASCASTTQPTKPAASGTVPAWNDIDSGAGANANSMRTAWFIATATNHTSGTWTTATHMTATVIKNPKTARPIGGHALAYGAATTSPVAPAATLNVADGSSLVLRIFSAGGVPTGYNAAPSGYIRQSSSNGTAVDTQIATASAGTETESAITSTVYAGTTIEIVAAVAVVPPPFDKIGAATSTSAATYTHPAGAANRTVLMYVILENPSAPTVTAPPKCAGVNMTLVTSVAGSANDAFGSANLFLCYSITGQSASALTITAPTVTVASLECNTVSYAFVGSVGTPTTNTAVATTATITGTTVAASSIFSCGIGFEEAMSSHNQTQRFEADTAGASSGLWIAESRSGAQTFNMTMTPFTGGAVPDVFMAILVELTGMQ